MDSLLNGKSETGALTDSPWQISLMSDTFFFQYFLDGKEYVFFVRLFKVGLRLFKVG